MDCVRDVVEEGIGYIDIGSIERVGGSILFMLLGGCQMRSSK